jgi:hypothetical protein
LAPVIIHCRKGLGALSANARVHIVESDAPPAGVGDPGVAPFAPALCKRHLRCDGETNPRITDRAAKLV